MLLESAERRMNFKGRRLQITLDLDSLPVEVFAQQPGSAWNGHYRERCYHPLLVRSEHGDFLGAKLRAGNVHTAEGGGEFVLPIDIPPVERSRRRMSSSTKQGPGRSRAGWCS
jgi:hypothetical protein